VRIELVTSRSFFKPPARGDALDDVSEFVRKCTVGFSGFSGSVVDVQMLYKLLESPSSKDCFVKRIHLSECAEVSSNALSKAGVVTGVPAVTTTNTIALSRFLFKLEKARKDRKALVEEVNEKTYGYKTSKTRYDSAKLQFDQVAGNLKTSQTGLETSIVSLGGDPTTLLSKSEEFDNFVDLLRTSVKVLRDEAAFMNTSVSSIRIAERLEAAQVDEEALKRKSFISEKTTRMLADVSASAVNEVVERISSITNAVLEKLFPDDPIAVFLEIIKTQRKGLSTGGNSVSVMVKYRNVFYDSSVDLLSFGELDRVSLALTISISMVFGGSFLLLDECMASLDEELREECLGVLRTFLPEKTVINVCHLSVEGQHDETVEI